MVSHGYGDDFDIVDADGSWNQYDSYWDEPAVCLS